MHRAFTVLGVITLLLIAATFALGMSISREHPWVSPENYGFALTVHMLMGFVAAIVTAFQKCAIFWHFIGSGVEIKHLTVRHGLPHEYYHRSWKFKMRILPLVMISPLVLIAAVVLAGAFMGGAMANKALHWQVALLAGLLNTASVVLETVTLEKNVKMIAEVNALLRDPKYFEPLPSPDWDAKGVVPARDAERPEAQASVGRALLTLGLLIWLPYLYFHFLLPDQAGGSHGWLLLACASVSAVSIGFGVALFRRGRKKSATGAG